MSSPFFWRSPSSVRRAASAPSSPALSDLTWSARYSWKRSTLARSCDRVLRGGLGRQGHHGLGRDHVAHAVAEEGHEQGEDGERGAQEAALEALGEEIADGHEADAAEEGRREPVERRQEEDQVLDPHAADALAVDLAGDDDGLVGVGRRPQVEEELVELAQTPAGDVESRRSSWSCGRPASRARGRRGRRRRRSRSRGRAARRSSF